MSLVKAGVQLIVFGNRERRDLEGVLKDCKKAGYDSVEIGFLFDAYSPKQLQEACKKYELEYPATHGSFDNFGKEEDVDKLIENTLAIGAKYLICSGVGKGKELNGFKEAASIFNKVGKKCKEASLTFCYHNHSFEFEEFDGIKGIDVLGKETDPELVKFNIDVAWVHIGGERPSEFIKRRKDRCGYYHFKDAFMEGNPPINWDTVREGKAITWTELGKGDVDLKSAYEAAKKHNLDYIVYEQDVTQMPVLQAITESRDYLKSLGI